jgi:hypothetical protein
VASKEVAVKKYVVRLSEEERARLEEFIRKGKRAAHLLTKARILLKADVSEAGDGWSDSRIAEALDTSIPTIERTRRQLVEEGFEAVLTRKYNPKSAPRRIFDGAAEAKLIALACGPAPAGRAKWTLRLLEEKVVELQIVESASDNTIGRTLKKTFSSPILSGNGRSRLRPARPSSPIWKACWKSTRGRSIPSAPSDASMKLQSNLSSRRARRLRPSRTTGASRLRTPTQWRGQSVHDVRAAGTLAARDGHGPSRGWMSPPVFALHVKRRWRWVERHLSADNSDPHGAGHAPLRSR